VALSRKRGGAFDLPKSDLGSDLGANAPEHIPAAGEPAGEHPEEPAPREARLAASVEAAQASAPSQPRQVGGTTGRLARQSAAVIGRRGTQFFLQLPGVAQVARRRRHAGFRAEYFETFVSFFRSKDPADNAETRLPAQEQALVPVIWLAEVFTPTTIDKLIKGIRDLDAKIDKDKALLPSVADVSEWVLSSRRQGRAGYRNLPFVTSKDASVFPKAVDELPPGIKGVHLRIQTLTSTVTVLTATFRLDEDSARGLEDILNQDRVTQMKVHSDGSFTHSDVTKQKAEAVDDWRRTLRDTAAEWIAERFPGSFCRMAPNHLPAIALLLTKSYTPWQEKQPGTTSGWADVLDLVSREGYWQAKGTSPLRLNPVTRGAQPHFLTLAATEADLLSQHSSRPGSSDLDGTLFQLDVPIPFLLAGWSLSALLEELEEQIGSIQDAANRAEGNSPKGLEQVRVQLLRGGLDSRIVANDIAQHSGGLLWKYNALDFSEVLFSSQAPAHEPAASLKESLVTRQVDTGTRVIQLEKDLREVLSTDADLANASANLRLQNRVFWLTVISVGASILAAVPTAIAVWHLITSSPSTSGHPASTSHSKPPAAHAHSSRAPSPTGHPSASRGARS